MIFNTFKRTHIIPYGFGAFRMYMQYAYVEFAGPIILLLCLVYININERWIKFVHADNNITIRTAWNLQQITHRNRCESRRSGMKTLSRIDSHDDILSLLYPPLTGPRLCSCTLSIYHTYYDYILCKIH
jgi:hypothetical protein